MTSGFELAGVGMTSVDSSGANVSEEVRLRTLETKIDLILGHLATSAAEAAARPAVPERRKTDPKFAALTASIDALAARFDRFETMALPFEGASALDGDPLAGVLTRLDGLQEQIQTLQDTPPAPSLRQPARFEAEKIGFERILTGFRLVLRDLAQQASASSTPAPDDCPALEADTSAFGQEFGDERVRADAAAVMSAFDQMNERMDRLEALIEARPVAGDPSRASARFEAEKVGFERLLTGFRLVLRDFADERLKVAPGSHLDADVANLSSGSQAGAAIEGLLVTISEQLAAIDAAGLRQAIDGVAARVDDLTTGLHQITIAATPNRPAAAFEAEKVGLTRLLTGFRLVLRDLADRVQQLEVSRPVADAPALPAGPSAVAALPDVASSARGPDPVRDVPEFDPKALDTIRFRTALSLILRHLGQGAQALEQTVERINSVPAVPADAPATDGQLAEILARLGGIEARLAQSDGAGDRTSEREAPSVVARDAIEVRSVGLTAADASFQRLLAGYRFILASLQRETEDLHTLIAQFDASRTALDHTVVEERRTSSHALGLGVSDATGSDLSAMIMMLRAEIDRLSGAGQREPAAPPPASDESHLSRDHVIDDLVKGLRRVNALGDRLASTVKAAWDGLTPGSELISEAGLAAEIRGQTAEFLAIGSALMAVIQK
jgi:hypothetical protein